MTPRPFWWLAAMTAGTASLILSLSWPLPQVQDAAPPAPPVLAEAKEVHSTPLPKQELATLASTALFGLEERQGTAAAGKQPALRRPDQPASPEQPPVPPWVLRGIFSLDGVPRAVLQRVDEAGAWIDLAEGETNEAAGVTVDHIGPDSVVLRLRGSVMRNLQLFAFEARE